jgi:hypothetical protein
MKQFHAEIGEEFDFFVICNNDSEFVMPYWGRKAQDAFWEIFPDGEGVLELFSGPLVGHYISRASFIDKYLCVHESLGG